MNKGYSTCAHTRTHKLNVKLKENTVLNVIFKMMVYFQISFSITKWILLKKSYCFMW